MNKTLIDQVIKEMREYLDQKGIPDTDTEVVMDFKATPNAEIGFIQISEEDRLNKRFGLYLSITEGHGEEGYYECPLYQSRFEIFALLEEMLTRHYQEVFNDDPCSFDYRFIFRPEMEDTMEIEVICTDYQS